MSANQSHARAVRSLYDKVDTHLYPEGKRGDIKQKDILRLLSCVTREDPALS